jgi:hypothetical protein
MGKNLIASYGNSGFVSKDSEHVHIRCLSTFLMKLPQCLTFVNGGYYDEYEHEKHENMLSFVRSTNSTFIETLIDLLLDDDDDKGRDSS